MGTRIWELMAEVGLLRDVVTGIAAEFEVHAARAKRDLLNLVRALLNQELIEIEA